MTPNVVNQLARKGAHFEVLHHPQCFTGVQEAVALGVPAAEVLKTLVLDTSNGHVLAVIPANRHLDLRRTRKAMGEPNAHLATEREIARDLPSWELGAAAPFGSILGLPVFVDPEVLTHPKVVFAAGTRTESIRGSPEELFAGEDVTIIRLTSDRPWLVAR